MGTINFEVAALCILLLNFFLFFSRSRLYLQQTRVFLILLLGTTFATVADIITVVMYWNVYRYSTGLLYAANILYYIFQNSVPLVFFIFLLALSGKTGAKRRFAIFLTGFPWMASLSLILTTPVTGWVFSFDPDYGYHRGAVLPLVYAIAFGYTLSGLGVFVRNRMRVSRETRIAIFLFLPFAFSTFIIQFFFPEFLLQNLGISLSALIVLLTVQDFGKFTDHGTNLYNRNGLIVQLDLLLQKKRQSTVFLVSLDTVNFLRLVLGPESFSALEREIAGKLFGYAREDRFASLTGQGKFMLVIGDRAGLAVEREQLLRAFMSPWLFRDRLLSLSARICEVAMPEDTSSVPVLFQAQYELTRIQGQYPLNVIIPFGELGLSTTGRYQEISRKINRALITEGLSIVLQPIVSAKTGKTVAAEALVRLSDPSGALISPGEFIPVAEQNGSIHRIGDFVVREACKVYQNLRTRGFSLDYLEVNLSPIQCLQPNLPQRFLAIIREFGLAPQDLCFEITETAANHSPAVMKRNLDALVYAGFTIAVDDFGTGYSNISVLMDLPFRIVKIDRSLIEAMDRSKNGKLGLEGVVTMFRHMSTQLVAEGVETADQVSRVQEMGIDFIQGYYYSRPVPPEAFMEFLAKEGSVCTG